MKDVRFSVSSTAGLQCFCMDTKGYHEAEKKVESFYRRGKRKQCLDTIGKSVLRMLLVAYGSIRTWSRSWVQGLHGAVSFSSMSKVAPENQFTVVNALGFTGDKRKEYM